MRSWICLCLLALCGGVAAEPACVLPRADGHGSEPSAPALSGVILRVELPRVLLRTVEGKTESVLVDRGTELFTAYGGGLDAAQLAPGQHAKVWLPECARPSMRSRRAAVVTVCSVSPEPCAK